MKKTVFSLTAKDFKIEFFRGSGAGGQHRNKTSSCCRITHEESGVSCVGTEFREQHRNRELAFKRLCDNKFFKAWCALRASEIENGKTIEQEVEESMRPENLKITIKENGQWKNISSASL